MLTSTFFLMAMFRPTSFSLSRNLTLLDFRLPFHHFHRSLLLPIAPVFDQVLPFSFFS
jgi:hypothetical protein